MADSIIVLFHDVYHKLPLGIARILNCNICEEFTGLIELLMRIWHSLRFLANCSCKSVVPGVPLQQVVQ